MYQPRKSILQMFDPLMASSPSTPKREESNASPDNSDKENDAPRDPLSLTQYFNRTYHVKSFQQPFTPEGKLIDFGDVSIDEDDELVPPGPSVTATEVQPDSGDVLLSTPLPMDPRDEGDTENATLPSNGPFVTPQNRRILGDIDVDALQPPKPPTKQGALKISFLTTPSSGSTPGEIPTANATPSDRQHDNAVPGPIITLYPPTFGSIPPGSSSPQISDKVDSYLSPQLPPPRSGTMSTPRRSPLSSENPSHRVSIDLQSSLQLQLQNAEFNFNLINDKVSFLESSQELTFPDSDEDPDVGEIVEDVSIDEMLKSLTLQDNAVVAGTRISNPASGEFAITSIPENGSEPSSEPETPRAVTPALAPSPAQDVSDNRLAKDVLSATRKPAGPVPRPSLASKSSLSGLKPAPKPPMRVPVPSTRRPSTIPTQRAGAIRPPSRQSSTMASLPKPVLATTKVVGKTTDGPRRVLVQASDKAAPRPVSTSTIHVPKTQGPQRVLLRTGSATTNPVKKPLGPSSFINPPPPTSRLPGPSRIAVPNTAKPATRASNASKSVGRWV